MTNYTFNDTIIKSEDDILISLSMIVLFIFMQLIAITTVFGNLVVILCFVKYKKVRKMSNYYILSLSIADLIIGLLMPFYAQNKAFNNGYWQFGVAFCRVWLFFDYVVGSASVFQIVVISFDRFVSVVYPIRYRSWPSRRQIYLNIFLVWFLAVLNYGPGIMLWPILSNIFDKNSSNSTDFMKQTKFECRAEFHNNFYYLLIPASIEFFIPFISISVFNLSIYLNIRQRVSNARKLYKRFSATFKLKTKKGFIF